MEIVSHARGWAIAPSDFAIVTQPLPELAEGHVLIRPTHLSVDPALRVQLTGIEGFVQPCSEKDSRAISQLPRPLLRTRGDAASFLWASLGRVPSQ
ncbi:hypothetical protein [Streptomyces sp. NPDC057199]|uniref:hypothetical protein n=1 Tax=Streptomyces sp. NPDC057199 TaxID=3346047 RepID=UPI003643B264